MDIERFIFETYSQDIQEHHEMQANQASAVAALNTAWQSLVDGQE